MKHVHLLYFQLYKSINNWDLLHHSSHISKSFQGNWETVYIFGISRVRGISWLQLETIMVHLASSVGENTKNNFKKIFLMVMNSRTNIDKNVKCNTKNVYIFRKQIVF